MTGICRASTAATDMVFPLHVKLAPFGIPIVPTEKFERHGLSTP